MPIHPDEVVPGMQGVLLRGGVSDPSSRIVRVLKVLDSHLGYGHKIVVQDEVQRSEIGQPPIFIFHRILLDKKHGFNPPEDINQWRCKSMKGWMLVLGKPIFGVWEDKKTPTVYPATLQDENVSNLISGTSKMLMRIREMYRMDEAKSGGKRFITNAQFLGWKLAQQSVYRSTRISMVDLYEAMKTWQPYGVNSSWPTCHLIYRED